jgi:hypothetical protein
MDFTMLFAMDFTTPFVSDFTATVATQFVASNRDYATRFARSIVVALPHNLLRESLLSLSRICHSTCRKFATLLAAQVATNLPLRLLRSQ